MLPEFSFNQEKIWYRLRSEKLLKFFACFQGSYVLEVKLDEIGSVNIYWLFLSFFSQDQRCLDFSIWFLVSVLRFSFLVQFHFCAVWWFINESSLMNVTIISGVYRFWITYNCWNALRYCFMSFFCAASGFFLEFWFYLLVSINFHSF